MFTITRDGQPITTLATELEVMAWFHLNVSYSMHHGLNYEGYSVYKTVDEFGNKVLVNL